jgi:hypothetical protein
MGFVENGGRWVDNRFRSAFLLLTRRFGSIGLAARAEAFATRNRGSLVDDEYSEHGWSAMLAAQRQWGAATGLVELLHVSSNNPARDHADERSRQRQSQLQAELRMHW